MVSQFSAKIPNIFFLRFLSELIMSIVWCGFSEQNNVKSHHIISINISPKLYLVNKIMISIYLLDIFCEKYGITIFGKNPKHFFLRFLSELIMSIVWCRFSEQNNVKSHHIISINILLKYNHLIILWYLFIFYISFVINIVSQFLAKIPNINSQVFIWINNEHILMRV